MSTKPNPVALIEAVLFASSQPTTAARLSEVLELPLATVEKAIATLQAHLQGGGLELIDGPDGYELEVAAGLRAEVAQALAAQAPALSAAALEVLTIIAYKQPITKVAVDEVRGIASDASLRALLARDLVVAKGKQEGAALYRTTNQFLKVLGLTTLKELPPLPDDVVREVQDATQ